MKVTKMLEFTSTELTNLIAEALRGKALELLGKLPDGMEYQVDIPSFYGKATVEIADKKTEVKE